MKAIKDNKVYTVDETTKGPYLARGFDITDDEGNVIERSPSSTVSRKEYDELLAKYEELKAQSESKKKGKSGGEPDVSES
jgi:hypothetical protein